MSILDVTVVSVAIPTLQRDFNVELTTIQWIATGYTLALATVIPLTAWAGDRFGTKRLYMVSIALFVAGSVLAGLAWDITSLLVFRVLQGLGGGMLMPVGMTILTRAAGPHRVGRVMSIIGVPMLLGPICGPILGGWLVDSFSWRWIFFINLPIGILGLILAARILPRDGKAVASKLDVLGLALLSPRPRPADLRLRRVRRSARLRPRPGHRPRWPSARCCSSGSCGTRCAHRSRWSTCGCSPTRCSRRRWSR